MQLKKLLPALLISGVATLGTMQTVQANVAANAQIFNSASLSYKDGGTPKNSNASVTVSVGTVLCTPTIISPANPNGSTPYTETTPGTGDASFVYNYTFNACGNGPADYDLATALTASTNTTGVVPTASLGGGVSPITNVGASVTVSGSTQTVINVPSDGTADGVVNGIAVGEFVVINTELRQVQAISDPGGSGVATITLASALTNAAPGLGVDIVEQASFTVTVDSGTINVAGTNITATVDTTVTSTNPDASVNSSGVDTTVTTFTSGLAVMTKLVRNATITPAGNAAAGNAGGTNGAPHLISGATNTYYDGGVTAETGDTLEYLLVITNTGGGSVTEAAVTDILPNDLVTTVGQIRVVDAAGNTGVLLTTVTGNDAAEYVAPTLIVNVGATPGIAVTNPGGTIGALETYKVVYQVQVR